MNISKKIALGLLISSITPATFAMDKAFLKCVPGFENFEGTPAQATQLVSRPDAVLHVRNLPEIDRPDPLSVAAAVTVAPKATAVVLADKAAAIDEAVNNKSFGLVDHTSLTTDIAKKISLLHDAGERVTNNDAIDAANDPLISKLLQDPKFHQSQVAAFQQLKAIRDAKTADLSDGEADEVIENLSLYNLGYSVADATANLRGIYEQLTTGQRHGADVEVKIPNPTKIDVDTLAALSLAGYRNPSQEEFNVVKTVFSDKKFAQETRNMSLVERVEMATIALKFRAGVNDPHFAHGVAAIYYLENVLKTGAIDPTIEAHGLLVKRMLIIGKILEDLKLVKDTGDLKTSVYLGCVRIVVDLLQPNGRLGILGDENANLDADTIRLLGYLREAEIAAARRVNPTALTVAANVTEKGKEIARRVEANPDRYLFAPLLYLDARKIAAVTLLDGFTDEDDINEDKIVTAIQVVDKLPVAEHNEESFTAVEKLLNANVAPTPAQIRMVRNAINSENYANAFAWKIGKEFAANANYIPTALATFEGEVAGNAKFSINFGPAAFAATAARVTAPVAGNQLRTILVALANLPAKATAAPWAEGDIAFFTNLQDDAVNADLVKFDNGDGAFPDNAQ